MLTKLDELSELLEGGGPGRGRGRGKKKQPKDETKAEEAKDKEASMPELDSKEEPASGPPRGAEGEKGDVEEDKYLSLVVKQRKKMVKMKSRRPMFISCREQTKGRFTSTCLT
jgi:hypothetical protein